MIVYGDASWETTARDLAEALRLRFAAGRGRVDLDEARVRLVLAGQLEQALADRGRAADIAAILTRSLADDFVRRTQTPDSPDHCDWDAADALLAAIAARCGGEPLEVRTPEGFAFYALYPDAYAAMARRWLDCHDGCRAVLVIGIRSIGTTLAAVVAAVLEQAGVAATKASMRPQGHPFDRVCTLPPRLLAQLPDCERALVVDEGPGLSGSSMAAVAEALSGAGMSPTRIDFLAGHGNGPGPMGASTARRWWTPGRAMFCAPLEVPITGRALRERLADVASGVLGDDVASLADLGAGPGCGAQSGAAISPPMTMVRFERPRLLARAADGRGVLLRFAGFAARQPAAGRVGPMLTLAEAQRETAERLAARGLGVPVAALAHGWLAQPWIGGGRLGARELDAGMLARIAAVIACSAGPPLAPAEADRSFERVAGMLAVNAPALLGIEASAVACASARERRCGLAGRSAWPRCGDGRLAPWEWVRTDDGHVRKAEVSAPDHAVAGQQPVVWDIAGACVEWDMDAAARNALTTRVTALLALDPALDAGCLAWWMAAYAALRGAMAEMALGDAAGGRDRAALARAGRFYRAALARALARLEAAP